MLATAADWRLDVERGPDCLFVRLKSPPRSRAGEFPLAERIWDLLNRHFIYRVVLDLGPKCVLNSGLVGQLIVLANRISSHDGMLRLCGLTAHNRRVLAHCQLDDCLPTYGDREEAIFAGRCHE